MVVGVVVVVRGLKFLVDELFYIFIYFDRCVGIKKWGDYYVLL